MSTITSRCIKLNGIAISCFDQGMYDHAMKALTNSIALWQEASRATISAKRSSSIHSTITSQGPPPIVADTTSTSTIGGGIIPQGELLEDEGVHQPPATTGGDAEKFFFFQQELPEGYFYVFQQPIQLQDDLEEAAHDSECQRYILSILVFNLALCCHLKAIKNGFSASLLIKSSHFYKKAYQLMRLLNNQTIVSLPIAAILSNLASIHFNLHNATFAQNLCQDLLRIVLFWRANNNVTISQGQDVIVGLLSSKTSSTFIQNGMFRFVSRNTAPAA